MAPSSMRDSEPNQQSCSPMNVDAAEYGSDEQRRQPVHGQSWFQTRLRKKHKLVVAGSESFRDAEAEIIIHWHKQRIAKNKTNSQHAPAAVISQTGTSVWTLVQSLHVSPPISATMIRKMDKTTKRQSLLIPAKVGLLSCFPLTSLACSERQTVSCQVQTRQERFLLLSPSPSLDPHHT